MRKLLLSLFIILNAFLLSACNEAEEQETNNKETLATPVEAEEVDTGDFVVEKSVYGQISPVKQTPVMVPQPGEVSVLKVENGDKVDKDDHIATIKTQMGNQAIYAPVAGEIAHLGAKENSFQSNEEPIALVVDLEKVDANFSVTASTREQLDQDKKVNVYIDEKKYEGTVAAIDPMPNEAGQYPIAVELDNEDRNIAPGMAAKLIVPDKRMKDTIIIPTSAVLTEGDESFVFVVEGDAAKKVAVDVKETQSKKTAVDAELEKGDSVIVTGHYTLSDGAKVDVVKEGK